MGRRLVAWANLIFLDNLRGSPLLNIFFCLLGCRIHPSAYLDTTYITGFDLVDIGPNAIVLSGACVHGHTLEGVRKQRLPFHPAYLFS